MVTYGYNYKNLKLVSLKTLTVSYHTPFNRMTFFSFGTISHRLSKKSISQGLLSPGSYVTV